MPRETIDTRSEGCTTQVGWSSDPETATDIQVAIGAPGLAIDGVAYDAVWVHLNRTEVNRLIRTLRRARDATWDPDA